MSYVLGAVREAAGTVGAWDSRWGFGAVDDWKAEVTRNWLAVKATIWEYIKANPLDPNTITNMNAANRLESEHGKVLNGQMTPLKFSDNCRQTLANISAPTEAYGPADAIRYVTVETVKDVKRVVKTTAEDLAKAGGEIVGKAATGVAEGVGVPEWLAPVVAIGGIAALAWWKLR